MMSSLKLSLVLYHIKQIDRELENNKKKKKTRTGLIKLHQNKRPFEKNHQN